MRSAFEEPPYSSEDFDSRVLAAAQWIVHAGQVLFRLAQLPPDIPAESKEIWEPGPLYRGEARYSLHRWQFWKTGFKNAAEKGDVGNEAKMLALKAANLMDALEWNTTF